MESQEMLPYWLPYTCGTIALVGCSIWLLRNSSLEGTKHILTELWNSRVKKPVNSIRNELTDSLNGDDGLDNRREEVSMMEASLHRQLHVFYKNSTYQLPGDLSVDDLLKHVVKSHEEKMSSARSRFKSVNAWNLASDPDLYRAFLIKVDNLALRFQQELLVLSQYIKRHGLNLAILEVLPALAVFGLLGKLARSYCRGAARSRALARKTAAGLLLVAVEIDMATLEKLLENGHQDAASYTLGMIICKIDSLLATVEPNARKIREWKCLRDDLISLARTTPEEREPIFSRLKFSYQSIGVAAQNALMVV